MIDGINYIAIRSFNCMIVFKGIATFAVCAYMYLFVYELFRNSARFSEFDSYRYKVCYQVHLFAKHSQIARERSGVIYFETPTYFKISLVLNIIATCIGQFRMICAICRKPVCKRGH